MNSPITDVVYEKRQFSPVSNGSINRCKVEQETVEAVDRALAGEDYSEGALFFMNRRASSGSNVRWFDTHLDYLFQHGGHEFSSKCVLLKDVSSKYAGSWGWKGRIFPAPAFLTGGGDQRFFRPGGFCLRFLSEMI